MESTNKTPVMVLAEIEVRLNDKIDEANKIIKDGGELTVKIMNELSEIEKEYATQSAIVVFAELAKKPNSKIEAIKRLTFPAIGHKVETTTDKDTKITKTIGIERVEKEREIDLLKFCKFAKLDTNWQFSASALNQSLCLWTAAELNYSKSELKDVATTTYLQNEVKKLAKGEKPASINALCKLLQAVIDTILIPAVEGVSEFKCNNHDVKYLLMCYTRKGKTPLSVKVANDNYLRSLIMLVMHRIVCGLRYTVDYKMVKAETPTPAPVVEAKPEIKPEIKPEPSLDVEHDDNLFNDDLGDTSWLDDILELPSLAS